MVHFFLCALSVPLCLLPALWSSKALLLEAQAGTGTRKSKSTLRKIITT